jgi:hypothetical protein
MNAIFDIKRFWNFIKSDFYSNFIYIIAMPAAMLGFIIAQYLIGIKMSIISFTFDAEFCYNIMNVLIVATPLFLYQNLYHKTKGLQFAMFPASQFEKLLSSVVISAVLIPALMFLICCGGISIVNFLGDIEGSINVGDILVANLIPAIQFQSVLFMGMFWFKKHKIGYMLATVISITIFIIILVNIELYTGIGGRIISYFWDYSQSDFLKYWLEEIKKTTVIQNGNETLTYTLITNRFQIAFTYIKNIVLPLFPYIVSFSKLRTTQI